MMMMKTFWYFRCTNWWFMAHIFIPVQCFFFYCVLRRMFLLVFLLIKFFVVFFLYSVRFGWYKYNETNHNSPGNVSVLCIPSINRFTSPRPKCFTGGSWPAFRRLGLPCVPSLSERKKQNKPKKNGI